MLSAAEALARERREAVRVAAGLERVQLVQVGPRRLSVRLHRGDGERDEAVWQEVTALLRSFLDRQGLADVAVTRDDQPPDPLGASGKYRQVVHATGAPSDA